MCLRGFMGFPGSAADGVSVDEEVVCKWGGIVDSGCGVVSHSVCFETQAGLCDLASVTASANDTTASALLGMGSVAWAAAVAAGSLSCSVTARDCAGEKRLPVCPWRVHPP